MLLGRARTLCCALLCSLVLLVSVSSASWIPNESAAAAAEYQNRGPSATAYELTLGDLLPEHLLREGHSLNFVNKHFRFVLWESCGNAVPRLSLCRTLGSCRLVGSALWPVSPQLVQALHQVAKKVCGTTRFICHFQLGLDAQKTGMCKAAPGFTKLFADFKQRLIALPVHASSGSHLLCTGLCQKECSLEVFPDIDNGDACQACGRANSYWQDKNFAALDLKVTVNYTRESMLIGTTMTTFARDITTMLHSKGVVHVSGGLLVPHSH